MRPLEDWLGFKVQYKGFVETWWEQENGQTRFLFENVAIQPFTHLHDKHKPRRIDHLWLYLGKPPEGVEVAERKITRLEQMVGCGEVIRYRRSDGSYDFGIKHLPALHLDKALLGLRPKRINNFQEMATLAKQILEMIDQGQVLTAKFDADIGYIRKRTEELLNFYEAQLRIQAQYEERKRKQQQKKPLLSPVIYPKAERTKTLGFSRN
jgi:hypothetical protein